MSAVRRQAQLPHWHCFLDRCGQLHVANCVLMCQPRSGLAHPIHSLWLVGACAATAGTEHPAKSGLVRPSCHARSAAAGKEQGGGSSRYANQRVGFGDWAMPFGSLNRSRCVLQALAGPPPPRPPACARHHPALLEFHSNSDMASARPHSTRVHVISVS